MRCPRFLLGLAAAATIVTAAGCGNVADEMPTVSGSFGNSATITLPDSGPNGYSVSTVIQGDGEVTKPGDVVNVKFAAVTWPGGESMGESFTQDATIAVNTSPADAKGLHEALAGKRVGSRVMVVLPEEGVDESGAPVSRTAVFAFDIMGIEFHAPAGPAAAPGPGLPQVAGRKGVEPTITIPSTPAPKELVDKVLIQGDGPALKAGDTIVAQYVGLIWDGERRFDSSWGGGAPASFPIGQGQVIPGWDKGLVGKRIGSRVLLVLPPDEGYGEMGNPQAGISGTDTLVFVVDILGTAPEA